MIDHEQKNFKKFILETLLPSLHHMWAKIDAHFFAGQQLWQVEQLKLLKKAKQLVDSSAWAKHFDQNPVGLHCKTWACPVPKQNIISVKYKNWNL